MEISLVLTRKAGSIQGTVQDVSKTLRWRGVVSKYVLQLHPAMSYALVNQKA